MLKDIIKKIDESKKVNESKEIEKLPLFKEFEKVLGKSKSVSDNAYEMGQAYIELFGEVKARITVSENQLDEVRKFLAKSGFEIKEEEEIDEGSWQIIAKKSF